MKKEHEKKEKMKKKEHKKEEHKKEHPKKKHAEKEKVTVAKGVRVMRGKEEKMREGKGSSSAGKYKHVAPKDFAGKSGGSSKYSFPINDIAHARNALARAHFAPDPAGIKRKVYAKYPELKKRAEERHGKKEKE